jgi:hypothetical protein
MEDDGVQVHLPIGKVVYVSRRSLGGLSAGVNAYAA